MSGLLGAMAATASRRFLSVARSNPVLKRHGGQRFIGLTATYFEEHRAPTQNLSSNQQVRSFSFTFAGPRKLDDILHKDLLEGKTSAEIVDIWCSYHENKENVHGIVLRGKDSAKTLDRAQTCPFFVQPIFRDDGFFMMVSQFQKPSHFLLAYLEDYKMDPSAAQPLLTFSIFDDFSKEKGITLVRCDILNKGIADDEGLKVVKHLLDAYHTDEEFLTTVHMFNKKPNSFDVDDYISRQNKKWTRDADGDGNDGISV